MEIIICQQTISPDLVQVLAWFAIFICVCVPHSVCVLLVHSRYAVGCVFLVLFIWKDSRRGKEKCQSIDGYFICLFRVGGSLESAYSFSGIKILL